VLPNGAAALSTDAVVQRMRSIGARYAYAIAEDSGVVARIEAEFDPAQFELAHFSMTSVIDPRCCFEVRSSGAQVRRYVYRLRP
jgi:hypothetical protein